MRSNEGSPRGEARTDGHRRRPGSRPDRLAEAGKQLAILLEDVDLDDEPDFGDALTDAVVAVDRAAELASGPEKGERKAWDRLVEDAGGGRETTGPEAVRGSGEVSEAREVRGAGEIRDGGELREEPRVESGGLQFVGEAGAE